MSAARLSNRVRAGPHVIFEVASQELELADGRVQVQGDPGSAISLGELAVEDALGDPRFEIREIPLSPSRLWELWRQHRAES